jgi:hypothetical protein
LKELKVEGKGISLLRSSSDGEQPVMVYISTLLLLESADRKPGNPHLAVRMPRSQEQGSSHVEKYFNFLRT